MSEMQRYERDYDTMTPESDGDYYLVADVAERIKALERELFKWRTRYNLLSREVGVDATPLKFQDETQPVEVPEPETPLPFTPRSKKAMELAGESARTFSHEYLGTEHILLGVARENEGIAAQVLMDLGITSEQIEESIRKIVKVGP